VDARAGDAARIQPVGAALKRRGRSADEVGESREDENEDSRLPCKPHGGPFVLAGRIAAKYAYKSVPRRGAAAVRSHPAGAKAC
jgi:hypothetical protein